jgi:hypothetical protein
MAEFGEKLHTEVSLASKGILNLECAVLPPSNKIAAVPLEATERAYQGYGAGLGDKVVESGKGIE